MYLLYSIFQWKQVVGNRLRSVLLGSLRSRNWSSSMTIRDLQSERKVSYPAEKWSLIGLFWNAIFPPAAAASPFANSTDPFSCSNDVVEGRKILAAVVRLASLRGPTIVWKGRPQKIKVASHPRKSPKSPVVVVLVAPLFFSFWVFFFNYFFPFFHASASCGLLTVGFFNVGTGRKIANHALTNTRYMRRIFALNFPSEFATFSSSTASFCKIQLALTEIFFLATKEWSDLISSEAHHQQFDFSIDI